MEHSVCEVSHCQQPACRLAEGLEAGVQAHRSRGTGHIDMQREQEPCCGQEGHGIRTIGDKPGVAYTQTGTGVPIRTGGLWEYGIHVERAMENDHQDR